MNNIERGEIDSNHRIRKAESTCVSDNGLFAYEKFLNFPPEKYFSKKILDVGAGFGERFNIEAASQGIEVVSLNPALNQESVREKRKIKMAEIRAENIKSAAGLVQELPFGDEEFEAITCLSSVPRFLDHRVSEYRLAFNEMLRVLKPDGEIFVYPIDYETVEGKNVFELVRDLGKVEEVEVFEKDHHGAQFKKGMIIRKKKDK
jgi:ubiquinone/menaquinone biosynthesis C-methylase UbiE